MLLTVVVSAMALRLTVNNEISGDHFRQIVGPCSFATANQAEVVRGTEANAPIGAVARL